MRLVWMGSYILLKVDVSLSVVFFGDGPVEEQLFSVVEDGGRACSLG